MDLDNSSSLEIVNSLIGVNDLFVLAKVINEMILSRVLTFLIDGSYSRNLKLIILSRNLLIEILDSYIILKIPKEKHIILNDFLNQIKILINNINFNNDFDLKKLIYILSQLKISFLSKK